MVLLLIFGDGMKKVWVRWAIFLGVFIVSLLVSNIILNQGTTDMTVEMQEATLPVISVLYDNEPVNTMYGYSKRFDNGTMRESISPIGEDRSLRIMVDAYNADITGVSYEIRSVDGSRLIENTNVGNYEKDRDKVYADLNIRDLINDKQEYNLCIILSFSDGKEAFYYTRIIRDDIDILSKVNFVHEFNQKSMDPDRVKDLYTYMEPSKDSDNTSLSKVDINNNRTQLGWGNIMPIKFGTMETTLHEIDKTTAGISLDYMINVRNGKDNYTYRVEEYYRIRQASDRFYLLSFDRTMEQIFTPGKDSFANDKIMLGIQKSDVSLSESEDGNIIAFENTGRLFAYDISSNKLATLYGFYQTGDSDRRDIRNKSKIRILNVEENGNVTFMVYGYFNRGIHEGCVGVDVMYYNSLLNTVEELAYIDYDKSPEILICDVDKIGFLNSFGTLYLFLDGNVMSYNLEDMTASLISDKVMEETLFVADSKNVAVWQEDGEDKIDAAMVTLDMKDGYLGSIDKKKSECATAIGYMNEDLIYGISRRDDISQNAIGNITFPMSKILIKSEYGGIVKEYSAENVYVTEGTIEKNQIVLKRVTKNEDGSFSPMANDQITNNEAPESTKNTIVFAVTEQYETIAQIKLKKNVETKTLKLLTPKEVLFEGGKNIKYSLPATEGNRYYLYDDGHIIDISDEAGVNVGEAATLRGTIVDDKGNEIYNRGETVVRNQIMSIKETDISDDVSPIADCLNTMLRQRGIARNTEYMLMRGDTPIEILEKNLPGVHVLNMSGGSPESFYYYLNKDIPILTITGDGRAILLIGYNEQNLVWYDPSQKSIYKQGRNDSAEDFEKSGNIFLTYSINVEQ